jgi:hypothetical protein
MGVKQSVESAVGARGAVGAVVGLRRWNHWSRLELTLVRGALAPNSEASLVHAWTTSPLRHISPNPGEHVITNA